MILADPMTYLARADVEDTLKRFGGAAEDVFGVVELHGQQVIAFAGGSPCIHVDAIERGGNFAWSNNATVEQILHSGRNNIQAIIGPSGVGKSTTIYRALVKEFGCYLDVAASPTGAGKFVKSLDMLLQEAKNSTSATLRVWTLMSAAHLTLLLVLQRFKELVPECTPKQWAYLMLSASARKYRLHAKIDAVLSAVFSMVARWDYSALEIQVQTLKRDLQCRLLYLDEAQEYLDTGKYGTFVGGTGTLDRSLLSPLVTLPDIVISGTGLNLQEVAVTVGSHAAKEQDSQTSPYKHNSSPYEKAKMHRRMDASKRSLLTVPGCNDEGVKAFLELYKIHVPSDCNMRPLQGRGRLAANFVRNMLLAPDETWSMEVFQKCMETTVENYVLALVDILQKHFGHNPTVHAKHSIDFSYQQVALDLVTAAALHHGKVTAKCTEIMMYINASLCMLTKADDGELEAWIGETAAVEALFRVCAMWSINPVFNAICTHMQNSLTSAAGQGLDFEILFVADVAMRALDPDATTGLRQTMFGDLASNMSGSPAWPSWNHLSRFEIVDCRKTGCTLQQFLNDVIEGVYDDRQHPVFCLPEEAAGPDVVTLLKTAPLSKPVLWMTQCKRYSRNLGGKEYIKAVGTTLWTNMYARKGDLSETQVAVQRDTRTLCDKSFASFLSMLCTIPSRTAPARNRDHGIPPKTTFIFIDESTLQGIMSEAGFKAAKVQTSCVNLKTIRGKSLPSLPAVCFCLSMVSLFVCCVETSSCD